MARRILTYGILFPLICVLFLAALGWGRHQRLFFDVLGAAYVLMLLPALVAALVDRRFGIWSIVAGFILVPLAIDIALYSVAHPRMLESLYLALAGATAAGACHWAMRRRQ